MGFQLDPLPTSEQILCHFAAWQDLAQSTIINTCLLGVRQFEIAHGTRDPGIDSSGVKAVLGKKGKPTHANYPWNPKEL